MTDEPSFKVVACPRCGSQHEDMGPHCPACGLHLEFSGAGDRPTLPSDARVKASIELSPAPSAGAEVPVCADPPAEASVSAHASLDPSAQPAPTSDMSMAKGEWKMDDDDTGATAPDPLIGIVVAGRYRITECVGRGGMGVVYRVEHTEIGKLLALKLLAGELSRQKEVVRRFKREALLASRLTHPNSVQVFDFGVSEGLTFLVMELVVGRDLSRVLRSEPMHSARLARVMAQVCGSLAEAHAMGIVHRDLKPENIMIAKTRDGADFAKVLDFGLAKVREAPELNQVTGTGQVVGTPYYMAPEQIHGHAVDGRADVYSLGAVMYEALTGEPVFRGSSPMAVFTKHLTQKPMPLQERAPGRVIPPGMEAIVTRCLEKSPEDRYQRVEDLQAALIEHLAELGQSGVDSLVNARMPSLQDLSGARVEGMSRTLLHEVATRDEVAAFQRKLARQRWLSLGVLGLLLVGLAYGGLRAYGRATAKPAFAGWEMEPNSQASEATEVPFGKTVHGMLGKRIDLERSDRDFYRIEVPQDAGLVSVSCSGLPNMAICLWLYRQGEVDPRGRYCTGRPGQPLSIPSLRMEPGTYLFAVMQDRASYDGREPAFVLENVSDAYALTVSGVTMDKGAEAEPNDAESVATPVPVGGVVVGRFDWVGDVDRVCAWPEDARSSVRARWVVSDADERPRDRGAVLEVTQSFEDGIKSSFRLHRAGSEGQVSERDVLSPWTSEPFDVTSSGGRCLQLRLSSDPWAESHAPLTPPVSAEPWKVRVEEVKP